MSDGAKVKIGDHVRRWVRDASANRRFRFGVLGSAVIVALDQFSKFWIVHGLNLRDRPDGRIELSGIFDLTYVENTGASFGMLAGGGLSRVILSIISIGVASGLIVWLGRLTRPFGAAGAAFVIGGALGNLYDRLAYGYVIDFLDFSGMKFPWVFNLADSAINIGVALLLVDAWLTRDGTSN